MSNHLNKNILLVGASQMAIDYYNVLKALQCNVTVIGKSQATALRFEEKTGHKVITGGLESFLKNNNTKFDAVIVAVGIEVLCSTTQQLILAGYKSILVEKPVGLFIEEVNSLAQLANQHHASVLVAYNRRFYASVLKAKQIIEEDGGVTSFNFEFTEWAHTIEPLEKKEGIKENWLLANSTHVIDLAFYLGGLPQTISCFAAGELSWHNKSIFSGAGKTNNNVLFSYQANWEAPGRWGVEVLTKKSRLIFRPMEELQIQIKGSVAINKVDLDTDIDKQFKPGLYEQTKHFIEGDISEFITIAEQTKMLNIYSMIAKGNL